LNTPPPVTQTETSDRSEEHHAIYCPSCAARVAEQPSSAARISSGELLRCPVCGTQFEIGAAGEETSEENAIVHSDTSSTAKPTKRLSTEEILLDRLTKEPPPRKQTPWTVVMLVLVGIVAVSLVIFEQTKKADKYAPGEQVDSTVLLQKQLFYQHIIDSLQQRLAANPQDDSLHLDLADAYYDMRQWTQSQAEFVIYLKQYPSDPNARVDYAYAIAQSGDVNTAISEIDTALQYDPHHLNALVNAGILTAETINDSNHTEALARAKNYFERAKAVAQKTDPAAAAKIDTLLQAIDQTGQKLTAR
jgi:tetratricopeptide (TPR) repeat protein